MSVIKRKTGFVGTGSKVKLLVNDTYVKKMKNNEEFALDVKEPTTIQVKQTGFGSPKVTIKDTDYVEIKANTWLLLIFILGLLLILVGPTVLFTVIGLFLMVFTIGFSFKNWFKLEIH